MKGGLAASAGEPSSALGAEKLVGFFELSWCL